MESLLPLLLIFAVMMLPMLFLSNRQKKTQQKQRELVSQLGVGDEVRTHSGFYGLIVDSFDDVVILESENGAQTKWARQAIASAVEPTDGASLESDDEADSADSTDDDLSAGGRDSDQGAIPGVTVSDPSTEDRRDR
ncbi:preprotein translocase subunit YajC [Brachybacterium sp. FME24]|uniref:preprotein translocase subunit YajC n=1 Tax=Brachybacterium sp. FME24 TaxID=2742605 RepID=UPI0027148744|nr:preprotein translocase subunit YajC [Brachybacterium sp. FME24]